MAKTIHLIKKNNFIMEQASLCFDKVKKDCLKFIQSQETSTEKFKNKEKMIKSFLIPICFWIAKKSNNKTPYFVGLAGGQGTGKTTISSIIMIILIKYFKLKVFKISVDDFYKRKDWEHGHRASYRGRKSCDKCKKPKTKNDQNALNEYTVFESV